MSNKRVCIQQKFSKDVRSGRKNWWWNFTYHHEYNKVQEPWWHFSDWHTLHGVGWWHKVHLTQCRGQRSFSMMLPNTARSKVSGPTMVWHSRERFMLIESELQKEFWTYAAQAAALVRNRFYCNHTKQNLTYCWQGDNLTSQGYKLGATRATSIQWCRLGGWCNWLTECNWLLCKSKWKWTCRFMENQKATYCCTIHLWGRVYSISFNHTGVYIFSRTVRGYWLMSVNATQGLWGYPGDNSTSKYPVSRQRCKHVDMKYHFLRSTVND